MAFSSRRANELFGSILVLGISWLLKRRSVSKDSAPWSRFIFGFPNSRQLSPRDVTGHWDGGKKPQFYVTHKFAAMFVTASGWSVFRVALNSPHP